MEKGTRKHRRVFRIQWRNRPGRPPVMHLSVPRDEAERLGLRPGESFRFVALGNILAYERMGRPE